MGLFAYEAHGNQCGSLTGFVEAETLAEAILALIPELDGQRCYTRISLTQENRSLLKPRKPQ